MEEIRITGEVESIIYENKENGYTVFSLTTEDDEVTCVGIVPQIHTGETLEIGGKWSIHPVYGRQIQVQYYEKSMPTTKSGMEKYLASGLIRGIGPKTAKKIVERFGEASFYVIEEKPEQLAEIRGLTYEKALQISQIFREQHELRRAMIFLQGFDVSPAYAMRIYKKYKSRTFDIVKTNPYRLADDIWGIGFRMADKMAAEAGIQADDPNRVKAAVKYVLNQAAGNGHCYLPKEELAEQAGQLLGLHPDFVENALRELQVDGEIWQENLRGVTAVYLNFYFYAEMAVAKRLLELSGERTEQSMEKTAREIAAVEKQTGVILAEEQRAAVQEAMSRGVLIVTGGPGTGKTTTINTILRILKKEDVEVVLAAPTGRAAKRMTEATGVEAQTIHRLLETSFLSDDSRRQTFERNEENPIEADVIIIDETSMVDLLLMQSLLRAVAPGTRLIFVGDMDQLPSVGPGNVLKDMIRSQRLPVVRLAHIFRQAQESAIIMNAHRINGGEEPVLNEKGTDFFFLRRTFGEDVVTAIRDLIVKRLPGFTGRDGMQDMQVLTPMRKGLLGVQHLNSVLQQALNPPQEGRKEKEFRQMVFREGDKVMQIKNNYNMAWRVYNAMGKRCDEGAGIFNGDEGRIQSIDEVNETMRVVFDDGKVVDYDFSQLEELELAYAITIHKSQGSEYPVVILPVHSGPPMLMTRNLLYTAITRARELVVLVGLPETISAMVANDREVGRYTGLTERIQNLDDFMREAEE
ncbi:ATP-dependent RecD-like DNA helicase [Anaerotignum lactatifermentans]|uniref:ATP-dependent RecD2 DNA helicase n=1 Tax=Anaerotignum lactatifermentans TaxID=160404 RepID=A0ABS2GAA2_9FIRM|nr:ATP-dependent RecD-like DNA helicase [Anaerotignum lactatifermentans]MBM6829596.1 ATP-dependent RecD-like DNA helicase [Anaerotignum lactatifermentans]MBM6878090.1 ATP-dependent RecD-like DNA helicase [Anaerotignum lactatifermentans]MBM6951080.1 ATP-dependent RecD-like DNA helicase [Anaerotignum lactatifermentans]